VTAGVILYEDFSMLDGAPIVVIATGLYGRSRNAKTGPMIQTWILRQDRPPTEALADGSDESICGQCPLRPGADRKRRCYVNVGQAPQAVWRAWKRGSYSRWNGLEVGREGIPTRLGAYGDPAAVPLHVWELWGMVHPGHTGYTHQWRHPRFDPRILDLCMASVESAEDVAELRSRFPQARYFRVRRPGEERAVGEMQCPASAEAGKRLTCADCRACYGQGSGGAIVRSVSIAAHGPGGFEKSWLDS